MGGRKHSLNLIGPGRGQNPPVFFYNTYRFENIIHINFHILKSKNNIYCAHTGVDQDMSTMGDVSYRHLNHSFRAKISQTISTE